MNSDRSGLAPNGLPLVLQVPDVAKVLCLGTGKVYELVRCGRLRSIKVGKKILVPRAAIFEFLGMAEETALEPGNG